MISGSPGVLREHWQPAASGLGMTVGRAGPSPSQLGTPVSQSSYILIDPVLCSYPQAASSLLPPTPSSCSLSSAKLVSPKQFFYPARCDEAERTALWGLEGRLGFQLPVASQPRTVTETSRQGPLSRRKKKDDIWHPETWGQRSLTRLQSSFSAVTCSSVKWG